MILVSACLCGVNCKYSGKNNLNEKVLKLFREGKAIPVCPEQLGGLSTPRPPCEIETGAGAAQVLEGKSRVTGINGEDFTEQFVKGAYETLKIAEECGVESAILKSGSPSCGKGLIYDGSFTGNKTPGNGITAELLERNGIKVYGEEEYCCKYK